MTATATARVVKGTNVKRYRESLQGGTWQRNKRGTVRIVRKETNYLQPDRNGDKSDVSFTVSGSPSDVWSYLTECLPVVRLASDAVPDDADTVTVSATWSY